MCRSCPTVCECGCGIQKRVCRNCGHYVLSSSDARAGQELRSLGHANAHDVLGPRPWQWALSQE